MKRIQILLLILAVLFGLCACGGTDGSDVPASTPSTAATDPKPDAPSDELLHADVEAALAEKNPQAALTGIEIVKSLTSDNSYKATVQLSAQTKYADWTYEAEVAYTKYDQGWMLDSSSLDEGSVTVPRFPTPGELITIAMEDEYFSSQVIDNYTITLKITEITNLDADNGTLSCFYTEEEKNLHATELKSCKSQWYYRPLTDSWSCASSENLDSQIIRLSDLTGIWKDGYGSLEILSFSADKIEAKLDGKNDVLTFTRSDETRFWKNEYVGKDYYLAISYQRTYSCIYVYTLSDTAYAAFRIDQALPAL